MKVPFIVHSPLYMILKIIIDVYKRQDLVIKAPKVSAKNRYVKSVKLNGREYDKAYLTHQDICNGGELLFEMSSTPNKKRVFTEEQKPYSMTK